ncbi:MAG TPA: hypothetical protein VK608_08765 [Edaphobacter sp.]|nr:hypothetical protein [Edaphobacter sp.]
MNQFKILFIDDRFKTCEAAETIRLESSAQLKRELAQLGVQAA